MQRQMEAHLDCPLPCTQLHVVFLPPAAMQGLACGPQPTVAVGANIIMVPGSKHKAHMAMWEHLHTRLHAPAQNLGTCTCAVAGAQVGAGAGVHVLVCTRTSRQCRV